MMNYDESIDFLFNRLPMFARNGKKSIKKGLRNIINLCNALDNPQNKFKSIHVAGTNGKGSTCHILAATMQESGYKTGLYTSPHLVDVRERIKINGQMISKDDLTDFVNLIAPLVEDIQPSYFEINVAMAFYTFAKEKVDIAIIETGLGGRLDSTNIITPEISVITSIAYDHMDVLGDTLDKIAVEKAGIIKPKVPIVIGKTQEETEPVFSNMALLKNAPITFADTLFSLVKMNNVDINPKFIEYKGVNLATKEVYDVTTDLLGEYQIDNIITAWAATKILENKGWRVNDHIFLNALKHVKEKTNFRGRWDFYKDNIIIDVAHNPDGINQVVKNLSEIHRNIKIVYGSVADKDVSSSVRLLPNNAVYYLVQADIPRKKPVEALATIFAENNKTFSTFSTVSSGVAQALSDMQDDDVLIIVGSFYVVGEAYNYLDSIDF